MKVKDLIKTLSEFPEDLEIGTGCTCNPFPVTEVSLEDRIVRVYPDPNEFRGVNKIIGKWVVIK